MSPKFSFDKENLKHIFHVFLWTVASALVTMLIAALGVVDFPPEYVFVVPIVNTMLVALKEFVTEQAR